MISCRVCHGERAVRLPLYGQVTNGPGIDAVAAIAQENYRDYPCPACVTSFDAADRLVADVKWRMSCWGSTYGGRFIEKTVANKILDEVLQELKEAAGGSHGDSADMPNDGNGRAVPSGGGDGHI